jgi:hypothetical protein
VLKKGDGAPVDLLATGEGVAGSGFARLSVDGEAGERDPTEVSRIQPKARRSLGKARTRRRCLRLTLALDREPSVRLVLVDHLRQLSPTHPPHAQVHSCAHESREQAEV